MSKNIILGASGLVGSSIKELLKNKKNYFFFSKDKKKFIRFNLDKNIKKFPIKNINTCFFLASPRIKKINYKKNNFKDEFNWLKNVILNLKIKKFVYLSSSSVYYKKNHVIGSVKKKCENFIIQNKKRFANYQIWRPYNLVGQSYYDSDHFHNFLFKIMFVKKKKKFKFKGSPFDKRGYSDVNDFTRNLYKFSKKNVSFIKNYGNKNLIRISEIISIYNLQYKKIYDRDFSSDFKKKNKDVSSIASKKNSIYYNKKSSSVLIKFLKKSLSEIKI